MAQTQTLNVEYAELIARAEELEQPLPVAPSTNPAAPCALTYTVEAAQQLALSADSVRLYLQGCQREWRSLAKSLREAAKAYQDVDEQGADSINDEGSGVEGASIGGDDKGSGFTPPPPAVSRGSGSHYYEVGDAVADIENGDHGAAFLSFADEWDAYRFSLQDAAYRFRPFTAWEGDARDAVEQVFEQQRQWILGMMPQCSTLSGQAERVVSALKTLRPIIGSASHDADGNYDFPEQHPGPIDMYNVNWWLDYYAQNDPADLHYATEWYQKLQTISEGALQIFEVNAALPLTPVNPSMFPTAKSAEVAVELGSGSGDGDGTPDLGDLIDDLDFGKGGGGINPGNQGQDLPTGDDLGQSGSTDVPSLPQVPTGPNATTPEAPKAPPVPSGYAALGKAGGVKPMSVAGGGAGAGLTGMPKPSFGDGGPTAGAAAAGAGAGSGRGVAVPSRYAALNGGGAGGGMPMGGGAPGGQGQKDAKTGKRLGTEDDALYTEDRAWTEGVIGRRRAQDAEQPKVAKPKSA